MFHHKNTNFKSNRKEYLNVNIIHFWAYFLKQAAVTATTDVSINSPKTLEMFL
jgi:hypothetical protein